MISFNIISIIIIKLLLVFQVVVMPVLVCLSTAAEELSAVSVQWSHSAGGPIQQVRNSNLFTIVFLINTTINTINYFNM